MTSSSVGKRDSLNVSIDLHGCQRRVPRRPTRLDPYGPFMHHRTPHEREEKTSPSRSKRLCMRIIRYRKAIRTLFDGFPPSRPIAAPPGGDSRTNNYFLAAHA